LTGTRLNESISAKLLTKVRKTPSIYGLLWSNQRRVNRQKRAVHAHSEEYR
jgi:hypothetical protein